MKRLALGLGNSTLRAAVYDEERLSGAISVSHEGGAAMAAVHEALRALSPETPHAVVLCSVVPALEDAVRTICEDEGWPSPVAVRPERGPMPTAYADPSKLGADRYCAALAAWRMERGAVIVVDCGTALTVNVVGATGRFEGGCIAPGIRAGLALMHARGAQLPMVDAAEELPLLAADTGDALRCGAVGMARHAVAGFCAAADAHYGYLHPLYVCGGDAPLLGREGFGARRVVVVDDLVLRGAIFFLLLVEGS